MLKLKELLIFIFFLTINLIDASILINPVDQSTKEIKTPRFLHGSLKEWKDFTVPIVPASLKAEELTSCKVFKPPFDLTGLAVIAGIGGCSIEQHINVLKTFNVSAIYLVVPIKYYGAITKTPTKVNGEEIPIMMITLDDFKMIFAEITKNLNNPINGTIVPIFITVQQNKNEYIKMTDSAGMIIYQIFVLSVTIVGFIIGMRAQILTTYYQGIKPSAPQLCLLFNNIGLFLYIINFFDYASCRRWYVFSMTFTLSLMGNCMFLIATFSLAFYFLELLRDKKLIFQGLDKFRIPFALTATTIIAFYIYCCVAYSTFTITTAGSNASVYLVISFYFTLSLLFFFSGIRVITRLSLFKSSKIIRLSILVFTSVTGMLIFCISYIILQVGNPPSDRKFLALNLLGGLANLLISIPQIITFKNPKAKTSTRTSTPNKLKNTNSGKDSNSNSNSSQKRILTAENFSI